MAATSGHHPAAVRQPRYDAVATLMPARGPIAAATEIVVSFSTAISVSLNRRRLAMDASNEQGYRSARPFEH
jgi:hypothetical protein